MATLTFQQLEDLWTSNGGSVALAPIMAGIALAESGGRTDALNNNPATGDYSVGLWQINYFDGMLQPRTQKYGSPDQLKADPNLQAKAAVSLAGNGSGLSNWTTYSSGTYRAYLPGALQGVTGSTFSGGSGEFAMGAPTAPGRFGTSPVGGAAAAQEGDWQLNLGIAHFGVPRSAFRKAVGAVVLVGGGAVMLLGTGWIAKGSVLQSVTKKVLGAPGATLQRRAARAQDQTDTAYREGMQQRDEVGERRRQRQREREQSYLSAKAEGERAAAEAGDF